MFKGKKKPVEKICANCKLYNPQKGICSVVILHEGQRVSLPVDPEDQCFYEGMYFDPTTKAMESFSEEIQEVKFWVEDDKGKKTDKNGTVKIEYPEKFFAPHIEQILLADNKDNK